MEQISNENVLTESGAKKRKIAGFGWKPGRFLKAVLVFLVVALMVFAGYFFISKTIVSPAVTEFSRVWRLVPEKVSRSAAIRVSLPKGMTRADLIKAASFDPKIEGQWVDETKSVFNFVGVAYGQTAGSDADYALFKPQATLAENMYYAVVVDLGAGKLMKSDFLAVEDPKIDAIFPANSMEAPEDSKITIVFNRPMVALSTADNMEPKDLPVTITPKTDGKWKWISTNTLQFIPASTLIPSSNYSVKIGSGIKSMDGLDVAAADASFKTRNLRYLDQDNRVKDDVVYDEPLRVYFNQPVDLEKTKSVIKLNDVTANKDVQFVVEYKKNEKIGAVVSQTPQNGILAGAGSWFSDLKAGILNSVMGGKKESAVSEFDKSVIEIYAKNDKFGRSKFWDAQNQYKITVEKAFPLEGDIVVESPKVMDFTTTGLIRGWSQSDGRSTYSGADMFDPQGRLAISFYEPVDLSASAFGASIPVVKKEYGQKCDDLNFTVNDSNCNKIDDKSIVLLSFDRGRISAGQTISVVLDKVVNGSGQKINGEAIRKDIFVYKPLEFRLDGAKDRADLEYLTLCSNVPLQVPERADFRKHINANKEFEIFSWGSSWLRTERNYQVATPCEGGDYVTTVSVGLSPESDYSFDFNINDVFGQSLSKKIDIKTGPMKNASVSIFPMQQETSVTTVSDTKLTFGTKNILSADISICKLSAYDFYRQQQRLDDWKLRQSDPYPKNCLETKTRQVELPERYWLNNYFDIDVTEGFDQPLGNYILTIGNSSYRDSDGKLRYVSSFTTVTGMAAAVKSVNLATYFGNSNTELTSSQIDDLKNLYWVNDIKTLAPVAGARVTQYLGNKSVGQAETDNRGIAFLRPVTGADLLIVEKGDDSTVIAGYDSKLNYASSAYNVRRAYIYSDRPIYRPGDKANIKGILRLGYDGNYQMWNESQVDLEVRDPRWSVVATPKVTLDEFGAFALDYSIDSAAALGNYQICVKGSYECGNFSVKEYVPAAFKVDAITEKEEYASKDDIKINISAGYYFGVPVANAKVEYTISSQNYYFDKYRDGNYNFGFYEECPTGYCYGDKFIGRGTLDLDSNGAGTINQVIDLAKIAGVDGYANGKIVVFDITATNSMGQSISTQKSVIVHAGQVYLGAKADPSFSPKDKPVNISAVAVGIDGKLAGAGSVAATAYKVDWIYAKRLEAGGNYNYDWTKKRKQVSKIDLRDLGGGKYSGQYSFPEVGEYEIDVTGTDKSGNKIMSREYVYIYGGGIASIRLNTDTDLTLKAADISIDAGQEGSLIIESPFKKANALITIERGKVFKYDIVDIDGSLYNYKFGAIDEYAPNVFVSVLLQSADPAVKFGTQEFTINSGVHKINIDISSDKKTYRPGDNVVLDLRATDNGGRAVSAEVSVAVVDMSVLALVGNPKKDPLKFFYNGFPLTVTTYSSVKSILQKMDKDMLSKGGGGNESESKVRGDFRDTAFWQGSTITDSNGKSRLEFKLPDNFTTWQAEAVAVSKDTKLGAGYAEFTCRNDLMIVPLKPRFIIPGDEFYIGAQVFNQSGKDQKIKIGFTGDSLQFTGKDKQLDVSFKSAENKTVYFKVKAPLDQTKGIHSFVIDAKGNGISDAIRQEIPVQPNLTYEAVATANYTTQDNIAEAVYLPDNVSKEQGGLTVKASATLAVFLSDALNYLVAYPYGCTEQISSRLKAMSIVKAGLNIPNVADKFKLKKIWDNGVEYSADDLIRIGLEKIYKNQGLDGGFGMWNNSNSNFYATLEAVDMLNTAKAAGVAVNEDALKSATKYLSNQFREVQFYGKMSANEIIAAANVILSSPAGDNNAAVRTAVEGIAKDNNLLKDKLSNKSLAQLSIVLSKNGFDKNLRKDVQTLLDNRITIDSRGAFLQASSTNRFWNYYESSTGNTALYLDSLALGARDTVYTDKVIRWLLNSRDKDGAWGSTQNTLAVVASFTHYLSWKKETQADFNLAVVLNDKQILDKKFNSQTILDQSSVDVNASDFKLGENNIIGFSKKENASGKQNGFYYDMGLKYYLSGITGPRDEGFTVSRAFYALSDELRQTPLAGAKAGEVIREHLEITVSRDRRFVAIEDYIPAGAEIVDMELATEQKSLRFTEPEVKYNLLRPEYKELRDDRAFIYVDYLEAGTYEFDYYVRALAKGTYLQLPCVASEFYNPENFGRSASAYFEVK